MPDDPTTSDADPRKVSRRGLLTGLFSRLAETTKPQSERASALDPSLIPRPAAILADHEAMIGFGIRLAGSTAHNDFLAWLKEGFARVGCYERSSSDRSEMLWQPRRWGLDIVTGRQAGTVPAATFRARSGGFKPDGSVLEAPVRGPLVYLGQSPPMMAEGTDIFGARASYSARFQKWFSKSVATLGAAARGAILVVDIAGPPTTNQGEIGGMTGCYYTQGPNHLTWPIWNQSRPFQKLWMLPDAEPPALRRNRPAGLLYIVDASKEALAGQFLPQVGSATGIPTLLLDREAGDRVRRVASYRSKSSAELTLAATNAPARASSLVFKLPGTEEEKLAGGTPDLDDRYGDAVEYVVVTAPSAGVSVAGGNGCLAMLAIARAVAAMKTQGKGLRRTLVLDMSTGGRDLLADHPGLVRGAAFAMSVENLGCSEWVDDDEGFGSTGIPEPALIYHDQGLTPVVYDSYIGRALPNHGVSAGAGKYLGHGKSLAQLIPTVSFVSGPTYLHQADGAFVKGGRIEQLDPDLAARQYDLLVDLLLRLDGLPKDTSGRP